ncbi:hypothetical protein LINPERHAP1_LOCUS44401 [Linum perenne]
MPVCWSELDDRAEVFLRKLPLTLLSLI